MLAMMYSVVLYTLKTVTSYADIYSATCDYIYYICIIQNACTNGYVSLSTVVLNSRDCQGKLWLPKKVPRKNNLKTILSQKTP